MARPPRLYYSEVRRQAEGRTWDTFSCQIQNRYLDDAGIWQDSEYYSPANLADLHLLTLRALMLTRVRERETQAPESASAVRPV